MTHPSPLPSPAVPPPARTDSAPGADAPPQRFGGDLTLIRGQTTGGKKFRPSDWCDRLYGALRVLGDEMDVAIEYVHIITHQNANCIVIDSELEKRYPQVYRFYLNFAQNNQLATHPLTRREWRALNTHIYPPR